MCAFRRYAQFFSSSCSSGSQYFAAIGGFHFFAKPMLIFSASFRGLISPFHDLLCFLIVCNIAYNYKIFTLWQIQKLPMWFFRIAKIDKWIYIPKFFFNFSKCFFRKGKTRWFRIKVLSIQLPFPGFVTATCKKVRFSGSGVCSIFLKNYK